MLTLALLAVLTQNPETDWSRDPEAAPAQSLTGRISLIGGASISPSGVVPGLGFAGELGVRIDRWALVGAVELYSLVIVTCAQAGAHAMYMVSPRVGLGFGVRLLQTLILASDFASPTTALVAPLRFSYLLTAPSEQQRAGFALIFDVAPGVQVGGTFYGGAGFVGSATVGLGWTAW